MKLNLDDSMKYLRESLSLVFKQETDREFRAEASPTRDVSVFCISPFSDAKENTTWRYVVQILSKNNTIVRQDNFDALEEAIVAARKLLELHFA
jgi:hypothetical protein